MESEIKKRHRLLGLLLIYVVAIAVCLPIAILTDGPKVYAPIFYIVVISGTLLYIKREDCNWRGWLTKPQPGSLVRIIVSAALVLGMSAFLLAIRTALWQEGITEDFEFDICVFIGTCLLAPIVEETVCRGIIVDILKEKHGSIFVIVVSALIFYVIHGNPMNVGSFAFGILAGWMVLKTRNIIPGVILHYIWNTTVYLLPVIAERIAA